MLDCLRHTRISNFFLNMNIARLLVFRLDDSRKYPAEVILLSVDNRNKLCRSALVLQLSRI